MFCCGRGLDEDMDYDHSEAGETSRPPLGGDQQPRVGEHRRQQNEDQLAKQSSARTQHECRVASCENCAALQRKLEEKDAELARVVSQMNSEMKISQGDHGQSKESIGVDYLDFFSHEWATHKSPQDKMEAKVELCETFQAVYDGIQGKILQRLTDALLLILQLREDGSEQKSMNDLSRAYARLLVSQNLTGQDKCPQDWEESFLKPYSEDQRHFIKKAVELSWKLATAVPPYIATIDDSILDDNIHEQVAGGEDIPEGGAVRYLRPTLYASFDGDVTHKGRVTK